MKQKTQKTLSKRVKITTKGKIIRGHANSSHLKMKKSKSRIRRQKEPGKFSKQFDKKIRKLLLG